MNMDFVLNTYMDDVDEAVKEWARNADNTRVYTMKEIAKEIYLADFGTKEYHRTAPNIGPSLQRYGFKRYHYKGRRYWVRSIEVDHG